MVDTRPFIDSRLAFTLLFQEQMAHTDFIKSEATAKQVIGGFAEVAVTYSNRSPNADPAKLQLITDREQVTGRGVQEMIEEVKEELSDELIQVGGVKVTSVTITLSDKADRAVNITE